MSLAEVDKILFFIGLFFTFFALVGVMGIPLTLYLYITFPKIIKEEFFQTHPDHSARVGYDSYMGETIFPFVVSLILFIPHYKKKLAPLYDFRSKLSKTKRRLFYINLLMASAGIFGLFFGIITMLIAKAVN
jgi:hypothetical protein